MILVRSKMYYDSHWPSQLANRWRIHKVWETESTKEAIKFFVKLAMVGYKCALESCKKDPLCSMKLRESIALGDGHFAIKDLWDVTVFLSVDDEYRP